MAPTQFDVGAGIPRPIAWITDLGGEYPPLQCSARYFFKCHRSVPHFFMSNPKEIIIQHLGVAVESIEGALAFWRDALGLELKEIEVVEDQGVRVAMLPIGESRIELLEAAGEETPVGKFLAKRGPGIHHLCVEVDDINAKLSELKARGARLIDERPRIGAGGALVAFVHPSSTGGVLIELTQKGSGE